MLLEAWIGHTRLQLVMTAIVDVSIGCIRDNLLVRDINI